MALFSSNKRVVFQPTAYGSTRRRRGVPRWLVLILTGIVLGSGGLLFLQKSYGPTRLTVEQSEQLHHDLNSANLDKQRLQAELNQRTQDLSEARAALTRQEAQVKEARQQVEKWQHDILLLLEDMPPDPRGTSPGIRAATFANHEGKLSYRVLLMQDQPDAASFNGKLTLLVEGRYPSGRTNTITLDPISFQLGHYTYVQGEAELPDAFSGRMVTLRVTEGEDTRLRATRIIRVR